MDALSVLLSQQKRRIGIIVPSVVISEKHSDMLEITEHPVETGAPVSDHAFKRPSEVTVELGFAGGGSLLDDINTTSIFSVDTGLSLGTSPEVIYQRLLDLQESRVPFDVITGKRSYKNMLIRAIEVTTDKTSENVLMCLLTLREVIVSQTQSITVADTTDMTEGVSTAPVQNTGTKTPTPVNESVLSSSLGVIKQYIGIGTQK